MLIGDRIRALREAKGLSQGNIEQRTGSLRSYVSRVERGHTGRAPTVAIAYLHRCLGWDLEQAAAYVKERWDCSPNVEAIRLATWNPAKLPCTPHLQSAP